MRVRPRWPLSLVVAALLIAPAIGQGSLLSTVQRHRAAFPASHLTPAQLADLLNRVAYDHRDDGWGLLEKPTGNNCPHPSGLISCDILLHRPSGRHFDVLVDSEGTATPTWSDVGLIDVSRWIAPVPPAGSTPGPPVPPPVTPTPPTGDALGAVIVALARIEARLDLLEARYHVEVASVRDQIQRLEPILRGERSVEINIPFIGPARGVIRPPQ